MLCGVGLGLVGGSLVWCRFVLGCCLMLLLFGCCVGVVLCCLRDGVLVVWVGGFGVV